LNIESLLELEMEDNNLDLSQLSPAKGSRKKRKRVGFGEGSGHGKTSCRGGKGQTARSGGRVPRGFEGGQMPLHRRLPKVGFRSRMKYSGENLYIPVSLKRIDDSKLESVSLESLREAGLISCKTSKVKILGGHPLSRKLVVEAHAFSSSAKEAIEKAGGEAKVLA